MGVADLTFLPVAAPRLCSYRVFRLFVCEALIVKSYWSNTTLDPVRSRSAARFVCYSPYGASNASSGSGLAFNGQFQDVCSGGYMLGNGHRFYSPSLMRFSSPDALSPFRRGGINSYAYCGGDPVNRHDPTGTFWMSLLLRVIGLASSGATLLGATVRTARNVIGRRATFVPPSSTNTTRDVGSGRTLRSMFGPQIRSHTELPESARLANQMFTLTGTAGLASHVALMAEGVPAGITSVSSAFGLVNTVSNLSGGLAGTSAAAREVAGYLVTRPLEAGSLAYETFMDMLMLDEMISAMGRGLTSVARGIRTGERRPATHV